MGPSPRGEDSGDGDHCRSRVCAFSALPRRQVLRAHAKSCRASIVSSLEAVATRMERAPRERARLHLLLAWTHALLLERQAFVPVGWSKPYAFSAADLACAHDILDRAVDAAASDRCAVVQTW